MHNRSKYLVFLCLVTQSELVLAAKFTDEEIFHNRLIIALIIGGMLMVFGGWNLIKKGKHKKLITSLENKIQGGLLMVGLFAMFVLMALSGGSQLIFGDWRETIFPPFDILYGVMMLSMLIGGIWGIVWFIQMMSRRHD